MLKPVLLAVAIAASGLLMGGTAQAADSGCFLNGKPVPDFQANSAVIGTGGADVIDCSASPKGRNIFAGNGNDQVIGSSFADTVHGEFGNDTLSGRGGNDFLSGEAGNDSMNGGTGTDRCVGQSGTDTGVSCESFVQ